MMSLGSQPQGQSRGLPTRRAVAHERAEDLVQMSFTLLGRTNMIVTPLAATMVRTIPTTTIREKLLRTLPCARTKSTFAFLTASRLEGAALRGAGASP